MSATANVISPPAPNVIITGGFVTLFSVAGQTSQPEFGTLDVALCGYGPYTPEVQGAKISLVTQSVTMQPPNDANPGRFEILLYSNDIITPAGTYYTFTVKDANGDIVQCEAYILSSGQYDLTQLTPYDPNQPPPPLKPLVTNQLQIVPLQPTNSWDCDGADYLSFQISATQDGLIDIQYVTPGNLYTFIIVQDATGGHKLTWNANIFNATSINLSPNGITIQTFVADEFGNLYAIGPGTYYP